MPRPRVPLIDRQMIVDAAIKILEADGLDGLSLRKLGSDLNVNPASIYHHFENKESILRAVTVRILREVEVPPDRYDWKRWMVESTINYWRVLVDKPFTIPIMLSGVRPSTEVGDRNRQMMTAAGIPIAKQRDITRGFEACALGSALLLTSRENIVHPGVMNPENLLRLQLSLLLEHFSEKGRPAKKPVNAVGKA